MSCKHRKIIAISENGKKEYYCKVLDRKISDYNCKDCMMKLEEYHYGKDTIEETFENIFGKGFSK